MPQPTQKLELESIRNKKLWQLRKSSHVCKETEKIALMAEIASLWYRQPMYAAEYPLFYLQLNVAYIGAQKQIY